MAAFSRAKEIITFQVGNYSNFVGAHYWNFQEALLDDENIDSNTNNGLNHDILFRNGLNIETGKTVKRPRVIALDLKENMNNFALTDAALVDDLEAAIVWDGAVEKYDRSSENSEETGKSAPKSTNAINDCPETKKSHNDKKISRWSDFTLSHFHDKSLQSIESLHSDSCSSFDHFGSGELLFKSSKFYDDLEDRLHYFVEECDRLQGFQVFADIHDGFAGLSSSVLHNLADDYAKKSRLCFAVTPGMFENDTRYMLDRSMLNILLSFGKFADAGCQLVPLSLRDSYGLKNKMVEFSHIEYEGNLNYHTSGILASAIDSVTLPYRLTEHQSTDLNTMVDHLSSGGRRISALTMGLPIPVDSTVTLKDVLKGPMDFLRSLTPDVGRPENILTQVTNVRGIPSHLLKPESFQQTAKQISGLFQYQTTSGQFCPTFITHTPCVVKRPFPDIFKTQVTSVGCVVENYKRPKATNVQRASVMASMVNCEDIIKPLGVIVEGTHKANVTKYPGFLEAGIEQGDIESCREDIKTLIHNYQSVYEI